MVNCNLWLMNSECTFSVSVRVFEMNVGRLRSGNNFTRHPSFHGNTIKKKPLTRRASIASEMPTYQENARKRAEEKRETELTLQKKLRRRSALSRKLEFDPESMRCIVQPSQSGESISSSQGSLPRCENRLI